VEISTEETVLGTHLRKLLVKGEDVSHLFVHNLLMRIGISHVRIGGIGGLVTKEEYRLKGYAKLLMNDTLEWMKRENYDATLLFGIPNFYYKFGYTTCMGEYEVIAGKDFHESKQEYKTRKLEANDWKDILSVYNIANLYRSCTIVRGNFWKWFNRGSKWEVKPDDVEGIAVENSKGDFLGYLAYDRKDGVNVVEANAIQDVYAVYNSALTTLSKIATEESVSTIKIYVPFDHPIIQVLKTFGCVVHSSYHRNAFGLFRMINLKSTFRKIKKELERRLQVSKFKSQMLVSISTDIGSVNLNIDDGRIELEEKLANVENLRIKQDLLSQLLVGYKKPQQVLYEIGNVEQSIRGLVEALSSEYDPYTWMADLF
jgi:predicted acetyltransferase